MTAPARQFVFKGVPQVLINDFSTKVTMVRLLRATDAKLSLDFQSDNIFGGNSLFPFDTIDKDRTGQVSLTNSEFDAGIITATMGSAVTRGTTAEIQVISEAATIPSSVAYTVDLVNKTTAITASISVRYALTGLPLTQCTAGSEAVGTYSVAAGVLTFAVADKGLGILTDYKYTVADGDVVSVLSNTLIPVCEIVLVNTFKDEAGNDTTETITIYKAKASGKTDIDQSRGKAATHQLDFNILDPGRSDNKMIDFSTARKS